MINEDVAVLTSGARTMAETVGYKYADKERNHRFRYLFDPLRLLSSTKFIDSYGRGENPFPLSVEIDPSNACNHDCSFCIYHSMHSKERSERMSRDVLFRVIDELAELGCRSILFVGGGEPMAHPATVDAIERSNALGISAGLVTNGSLVKSPTHDRLRKNATYVRFSLDAASRALHHQLHRNDDHDRIISNLRGLAAANGPCTVGTGFFINEDNVHEAYDCAALVKDSGADYIQFKSYSGIAMPPELQGAALEQLDRAIELQDDGFDVHIMDRIFENGVHQVRGYSRCHWQAFKPIINADGSVFLCAQKRTNKTGIIGNVYDQSLREIWDGDRRKSVLDSLVLKSCPYCVHDKQNKMIEFLTHNLAPHERFF